MHVRQTAAMIVALVCGSCAVALAQTHPKDVEDSSQNLSWEDAAKKDGLTLGDIAKLRTDKVLMTNETFKQVFDPYIDASATLFITADSLLNGFHVLYEESILRMEKANARRLPEILGFIWKTLPSVGGQIQGKQELVLAARRRAQVVIATALRLCGDKTVKPPAEIEKLIEEEVKRVEAAEGQFKPKWLGPPDAGFVALDYTRYRPRGFYTKSETLQRHFRAVSWLQSIPFRVASDEELLSILMLGNSVTWQRFKDDFAGEEEVQTFFRGFNLFLGAGDDWDIMTAAQEAQNETDLDPNGEGFSRKRKWLTEMAARDGEGPKINDQVRFAPEDPTKTAEPEFRIVSAYRTPDAILFHRTTDLRTFHRALPSGLEVCTALGSAFARSKLTYDDRDKLLKTIDDCKPLFEGESLYLDYLDCLRALLDEPEPDAPAFMKGDAWKTKSCQAALGGWAQLRHTWALQAKETAMYLGLTEPPTGFVEPDPEFFARMGRVAGKSEFLLKAAGAFDPDTRDQAEVIRAAVDLIRKKDFANKGENAFEGCSWDEWTTLGKATTLLMSMKIKGDMQKPALSWPGAADRLAKLADDLEKGVKPEDRTLVRAIEETDIDISKLWRRLGYLCSRLEALSHKQLRGVPFSREEDDFLKKYGTILAGIMLYGGNSYLTPRDDAPRVVDVFSNPNKESCLEAGVGRPRALYVLYPVKGREVLAKGAVMPYYEFEHAKRLTDAEWKTLLDSHQRPEVPEWVKPIVGKGGIKPPEPKEDQ